MIRYLAIRKNAESFEQIQKKTYGICACKVDGELIEIVNCVDGISNNLIWVRAIVDKLNRCDVDPIHLYDIIEDELYTLADI